MSARILRADEHALEYDAVKGIIEELQRKIDARDQVGARELLIHAVREYAPTDDITDLTWLHRNGTTEEGGESKVLPFPKDAV